MTIMTQGGSDRKMRRCDGTCHKAKKVKCACICGGRYHGKGSSEAAQQQLTKDWLGDDWQEKKAAIEAQGGSFEAVISEALQGSHALFRMGDIVSLKRFQAGFLRYESSYDGKAILKLYLHRKTNKQTNESLEIEIEMERSSIFCVHKAMKQFADKEREQVGEMPL